MKKKHWSLIDHWYLPDGFIWLCPMCSDEWELMVSRLFTNYVGQPTILIQTNNENQKFLKDRWQQMMESVRRVYPDFKIETHDDYKETIVSPLI